MLQGWRKTDVNALFILKKFNTHIYEYDSLDIEV